MVPKEFLLFFSIGSLSLFIISVSIYLVFPKETLQIYKAALNYYDNKAFLLFLFTIFPLIYTLGATILVEGEHRISKCFNLIADNKLIQAIKSGNLHIKVEKDLNIYDFIYASQENIWINQSNVFYQYSNLFAGIFRSISDSYLISILIATVITAFYSPQKVEECSQFITIVVSLLVLLSIDLGAWFLIKKLVIKYGDNFQISAVTTTIIAGLLNAIYILSLPCFAKFVILKKNIDFSKFIIICCLGYVISSLSFYLSILFRKKANVFLVLGAASNKSCR